MKKINLINVAIVFGLIGLTILILSLIWIIFDRQYFSFFSKIDSKTASELGGFIGGFVGIFWSTAGVILIYATFNEQRKLSEKQQFESTFFNLINTYHNIVFNTEGKVDKLNNGTTDTYRGRDFFSSVLSEIKTGLSSKGFTESICRNNSIPEINRFLNKHGKTAENMDSLPKPELEIGDETISFMLMDLSQDFIIAQYEYFYKIHQASLGHYFRFIYNIIKFTIEERTKYSDEQRYINFIQAQMSNDELGLIFYNVLSRYGKTNSGEQRFFSWLNKYDFFENIDEHSLINRNHHKYYKAIFKFLDEKEKIEKHAAANRVDCPAR